MCHSVTDLVSHLSVDRVVEDVVQGVRGNISERGFQPDHPKVIHHSEARLRNKCEDIHLKLELSAARVQTFVFPEEGIDLDILFYILRIN